MQGNHHYQPELFSQIDFENLIPRSHLLRKIDRVLDLSFLRNLTAPFYVNEKGRPSIDPEIFVRMVLLESLYDINSDRQLCEEVSYNLAYRWFCKLSLADSVPDHSSITRIRDRLGEEVYRDIFLKVVNQCKDAGLIKGQRLMTDGSLIKANAANESLRPKDISDTNDYDQKNGPQINNTSHVSKTDPEATLAGKESQRKFLGYKTHYLCDFDTRVILGCPVTTGAVGEVKVFSKNFEEVKAEFKLNVQEVIADRGYGSVENLRYLEVQGVESNIALWSEKTGSTLIKNLEQGFKIDEINQSVHCPEGHKMHLSTRDKAAQTVIYTVQGQACLSCVRSASCRSEYEIKSRRSRKFSLSDYYDIYLKTLEKQRQPSFIKKLSERMWKLEGLFAEGKNYHGLRRARYRGRAKTQMQVYLVATIQNLKRLAGKIFLICVSISSNLEKFKFEPLNIKKYWMLDEVLI